MLEITRDENGWEWSGKPLNHSRNHVFLSGTGTPDGNTKPILRDIGERNNSIGNKPVTIGNRKLKTGTTPHVTFSNI